MEAEAEATAPEAFEEFVAAVGAPIVRERRPIGHRRRSPNGPALVALGVLLAVAGGLGYAVIGSDGVGRLIEGTGWARPWKPGKQVAARHPSVPAAPGPSEAPPPAAVAATDTPAVARLRMANPVPQPESSPPPVPSPPAASPTPRPEEPEGAAPQPLDDEARRAIDEQLALALEALRSEDFRRAERALAAAADRAAADADVLDRVSRWQLLAEYVRQFPKHRDDALRSAGEGRDYEIGNRVIGVVEVNDQQFIYREKGQNIRVPRNAIPDDILFAIVKKWFARADRVGNNMMFGAIHVTRPRPDLEAARREWSMAARRGEPTGRKLLLLLDDPLLGAAPNR